MDFKQQMEELKGHLTTSFNEIKELVKQQDTEIKQLGSAREETGKKLNEATERLTELKQELENLQKRIDDVEAKSQRPGLGGGEARKSIGAQFVESEAYKSYVSDGLKGRSAPLQTKALISGASLGNVPGYLYQPDRVAEIVVGPDRLQRVRDLFSVNRTTSGAIEFIRETGFTNAAAAVPEGSQKPESGITFELVTTSVKTIAHFLPATRQILSDAPALQDYIDNRLLIGLKLVEDEQLLYGDGTGANLSGVATDPDIQSYAWSSGQAGDTKVDAVRRALTRVRVAEYPATGVILHPNDWEEIELLKGSDQHYIWVSVADGGVTRLWRVPVVETTAINPGEALTGAFDLGAAIWDREDAAVRISDSHADFFIRNQYAILAEERIALTIYRPEAFVLINFDNAPPAA